MLHANRPHYTHIFVLRNRTPPARCTPRPTCQRHTRLRRQLSPCIAHALGKTAQNRRLRDIHYGSVPVDRTFVLITHAASNKRSYTRGMSSAISLLKTRSSRALGVIVLALGPTELAPAEWQEVEAERKWLRIPCELGLIAVAYDDVRGCIASTPPLTLPRLCTTLQRKSKSDTSCSSAFVI
ncbi:hypothetical protein HYPSUDRAFT_288713 [Hypholoma sublateritium FD-334 SS-4]|uniref:Uncharacterized protein n=1 Tax=Hypholoma sublateritium (strain FD-334 SS-4) TaxID=945553 RepID=A0A0D2P850_HYPSF|nr:hypothetical protein HYPSUDRAFT_288713 [Hypholoma sublateritium FD-334 SS-4]